MHIKLQKFLCLITLILLMGCNKAQFVPSSDPDFTVPELIPSGSEKYLSDNTDVIFDQSQLHTFELRIPGASLTKMNKDPAAEEYVEGMLIFKGDTISPVGIRYKGSVGGWIDCLTGKNAFEPSGFKTCTKLSMRVKVDWQGREERFYGLKKLQFHSQNMDASHMRERLGYWLFRQMDVPAPRSVHARVVINGHFAGLFGLTEQVDSRFVKNHFEDKDGNLYKEVWPLRTNGTPRSVGTYVNALRTNRRDSSNVALIRKFGREVAAADSLGARAIVEKYMDIDEIMSYVAVDRTIRHDDGPFHWYCNPVGCYNHNYFWYEEPKTQKLHLIPWDLDNAFENIISNANSITPIYNQWGDISNDCEGFRYLDAWQWSAACDKLTATWVSYAVEYDLFRTKLIEGPMSRKSIDEVLSKWQNQIRQAVVEAQNTHADAVSVDQWETAINDLKRQLEYARGK